MMLPETIRTFILGNPILVPTMSTATSFFFGQMVSNYKLMALAAVIVSICIFMLVSTCIRHRGESSTCLIYASGLMLFFAALGIRLIKGPGEGAFLLSSPFLSRLTSLEEKDVVRSMGGTAVCNAEEHSLLSLLRSIRLGAILHYNKSTKDTKCISGLRLGRLEAHGETDEPEDASNPSVSKGVSEPKKVASTKPDAHPDKKSPDPPEAEAPSASLLPVPTRSDGAAGDRFIKKVLHTLNAEFDANNSISKYFQEMNQAIDKTTEEARKFDSNLRRFFRMSAKIEKEMKSFNASTESCDIFRSEMLSYVKSIVSLKSILDNLNYRDGTDAELNSIFKRSGAVNGLEPPLDSTHTRGTSISNAFCLFLVFQFGLGLFLLYSAVVRSNLIFAARLMAVACLALDLAATTLFMAQAHVLDKSCILGHVSGCEFNFGTGLADFAASANIDLKSDSSKKLESVARSLEKIQHRAESTVAALRLLFEESPIAELEKRSVYFSNLLGKIRFVEDDFGELTHSKVSKSEFFALVEAMELGLSQMSLNLRTIDPKKLLDFYTREVGFLYFVKGEKANILISIENQIEGRKSLGDGRATRCEQKKARLCKQKDAHDLIFMMLMAGPVVLMTLLLF